MKTASIDLIHEHKAILIGNNSQLLFLVEIKALLKTNKALHSTFMKI